MVSTIGFYAIRYNIEDEKLALLKDIISKDKTYELIHLKSFHLITSSVSCPNALWEQEVGYYVPMSVELLELLDGCQQKGHLRPLLN